MLRKIWVGLSLTALLSPSIVLAQTNTAPPAQNHQQLIQKLGQAREIAAENASSWTQEPITATDFNLQEAQLTDIIDRLKAGEKVSPEEINQALKSPDTPY